jgi:hypothetical protein
MKMKTREELKNDGINLWNSRCVELIDSSEDMGLRLMNEGKDTETLVGMDLAIDLLLAEQRTAALEDGLKKLAAWFEALQGTDTNDPLWMMRQRAHEVPRKIIADALYPIE